MVKPSLPLFQFPQETWDKAKCEKLAKRKGKNAPFKGYLGSAFSIPPAYGEIRYNGGCVHGDKWWQGENRPLPIVAEGFEIVYVSMWGWRLKKKD